MPRGVLGVFEKEQYEIIKIGTKYVHGKNAKGYTNRIVKEKLQEPVEIGQTITIRGYRDFDLVTPLTDEELNEKEIKELKDTVQKFLGYIENNIKNYWYENGEKKVKDAIDKLEKLGADTSGQKQKLENLYDKYLLNNAEKLYHELKNKSYPFLKSNKFAEFDNTIEEIENRQPEQYGQFMEKRDELVALSKKIENKEKLRIYEEMLNNKNILVPEKGLINISRDTPELQSKVDSLLDNLKSLEEQAGTPSDELINNIFVARDNNEESTWLKEMLHDIRPLWVKTEYNSVSETINECTFYGKVYFLDVSISKKAFKELIKADYIRQVRPLQSVIAAVDPVKLAKQLLLWGEIKELGNQSENEEEMLKLWLNIPQDNEWNYRKEEVYGEIYYFVSEKKFNPMVNDYYYAYYICGLDKDTGRGFSHRIPWQQHGYYENLTVKEILDDTFYFNQGFSRVQGDIVAKSTEVIYTEEVETTRISWNDIIEKDTQEIVFKTGKHKDYTRTENNIEVERKSWTEPGYYKKYEGKINLRKDLAVQGVFYIHGSSQNKHNILYALGDFRLSKKSGQINVNVGEGNMAIIKKDDEYIDIPEDYKKLSHNFYYKIIQYKEIPRDNTETRTSYLIKDKYSGKIIAEKDEYGDIITRGVNEIFGFSLRKIEEKTLNERQLQELRRIGDHRIEGGKIITIDADMRRNERGILGPFKLWHREHMPVELGGENIFTLLVPARRHHTRGDLVLD